VRGPPATTRTALAVLAALATVLAAGCDRIRFQSHDHDDDLDERGDIAITHFTDRTELFVEFPQLVVGEESPFAAHVTDLTDFKPLLAGEVTAVLSAPGAAAQRFSVTAPRAPGIFVPRVVPTQAGPHTLGIEVRAETFSVTHDLGTVVVFADLHAALLADPEDEDDGIAFLKEQQWQVDFATGLVGSRTLRHGLPAAGFLRAAANADSVISAPAAGFLLRGERSWPVVGETVQRGDRLAMLAPRLAAGSDVLSLELGRDTAAANHALALQQLERLEDLFERQAVPERSVVEARAAVAQARAELAAAERRLEQLRRDDGGVAGGIALLAPISGVLVEAGHAPGTYVDEGVSLFRLVDTSLLWLEVRVPEADVAHLGQPAGAVIRWPGSTQELEIEPGRNGRLVSSGRVVDPQTRTVGVIFELDNAASSLPIDAFVRVRLLTGEAVTRLAVPEPALVDDAGQTVVFVQLGGENFERRVVQTGVRDAGHIEIVTGLADGERIVTRGAYLVRLAAASPSEAGAGHTH
jgi:membrane fusion protein, heavy metal efflux system